MDNFSQITGALAVVAYGLATLLLLRAKRGNEVAVGAARYRIFAIIAIVLHAISIYNVMVTDAGLRIGFFPALSLTSLLVV